jgi:hypothetical protein
MFSSSRSRALKVRSSEAIASNLGALASMSAPARIHWEYKGKGGVEEEGLNSVYEIASIDRFIIESRANDLKNPCPTRTVVSP